MLESANRDMPAPRLHRPLVGFRPLRRVILSCVVVCALLSGPSQASAQQLSTAERHGAAADGHPVRKVSVRTYAVRHRVTLTRSEEGSPSQITVVIPYPEDTTSQRVTSRPGLRIDPVLPAALDVQQRNPYCQVIETEPFGARVVYVRLEDPPTAAAYVFTLSYTVDSWNLRVPEPALRQVPLPRRVEPSLGRYLSPESRVESDDPAIREALRTIFPDGVTPGRDTVYEVARRIYSYVIDQCEYTSNADQGRRRTLWGALDMLAGRRGECGDYAAMFIALCRAAGIPARAQVGFWTQKPDEPHIWAEFHVPGIGWTPVDPSVGDRARRTVYFAQVPDLNRRVIVSTGFDHHFLDRKVEFLQTYSYWFRWRGTPVRLRPEYSFSAAEVQGTVASRP